MEHVQFYKGQRLKSYQEQMVEIDRSANWRCSYVSPDGFYREYSQLRPVPLSDRLGVVSQDHSLAKEGNMPAQRITASATGQSPAVPLNGFYPKYLKGSSGAVWLMTAPKTGVLLVKGRTEPFRNKSVAVGYATTKLKEGVMEAYHGTITINVAA